MRCVFFFKKLKLVKKKTTTNLVFTVVLLFCLWKNQKRNTKNKILLRKLFFYFERANAHKLKSLTKTRHQKFSEEQFINNPTKKTHTHTQKRKKAESQFSFFSFFCWVLWKRALWALASFVLFLCCFLVLAAHKRIHLLLFSPLLCYII